jgi:uncharacterized NAD(P)/FAD-binding protein YdhS
VIRRVAIVGGGFSGALQAINLLRNDGPDAVLIERRPEVGRGVAYSAADPGLLLNVRAANMSALPDEPTHFTDWLQRRGLPMAGFVPRIIYGEYLAELLQATRAQAPHRLEVLQAEAVRAGVSADGVSVGLADGRTIVADALVLAIGNLPPAPPDPLDPDIMPPGTYAADPWAPSIAEDLAEEDLVLVIGTGLTMVDAVLLLDNKGFRGRIVALSRRGLMPRPHETGMPVPGGLRERPPIEVTRLLREVRERAAELGWHAAVDELRPYTRGLWLAASEQQRARFLRHLRPWWEVHRHRIAPAVAERLAHLRAEGRLRIIAGKMLGFDPLGSRLVEARWRARGRDDIERLPVRRVINCSGPRIDVNRTGEPLLRQLRADGLIVPDSAGLGLAVDQHSHLIGADGTASPRLFALGPMTRGTFWEITAVPDIRIQTWELARRLSNAHWVAGEGL